MVASESETAQSVSEVQESPQILTAPVKSSEAIIWDFFISKGFSKEQVAGIMGNLKQESNFKTEDTSGGLGIAQWLGARRERLIQRGNHLDLNAQLDFIIEELQTTESPADKMLRASYSVEEATVKFQNLYERCGDCRQAQRINYAFDIYYRYR